MTENEIYDAALRKFGIDKQIEKMIEECGELIVALMHFKDGRQDVCVHEEIADVYIVLKQIWKVFDEDGGVEMWKEMKLQSLEKRINGKG